MKRINGVNQALAVIAVVALPVATYTQGETVPQAMARGAEGRFRTPTFLYQTQPSAFPRPGIAAAITVTQLGGTITVNGQSFKQTEQGLPPLLPGTDGLFFGLHRFEYSG